MFEVRCIVADKNLGNVLKALNGLTIEPPVTLVVEEGGPETAQDGRSNPTRPKYEVPAADALKEFLSAKPVGTIVTRQEILTFLVERNYQPSALGYALAKAIDSKMLKIVERGRYERDVGE